MGKNAKREASLVPIVTAARHAGVRLASVDLLGIKVRWLLASPVPSVSSTVVLGSEDG
jgi:hypothetical protein